MKPQKQIELLKELDNNMLSLLEKKAADYAKDTDTLSNFKIVSKICELLKINVYTPEGYNMLMIILKITRISNLLEKNVDAKNEPLIDSYEDLIGYSKLGYLLQKDK